MKVRDLIGARGLPSTEQLAGLLAEQLAEVAKARKRVARMSTHEMLEWADVAGSGMAKAFGDYRKEGAPEALDEIRQALLALSAVTDELAARQDAQNH